MFVRTERLLLRPAWCEDAPALSRAVGDEAVARNSARIPWPYCLGDAEAHIARQSGQPMPSLLVFRRTRGAPELIGGVGLAPDEEGHELGYWIARRHWGLGYATEAGRALVKMARDSLRLRRLHAGHFLDNPASGRVLRKLGFKPTGEIVSRHSVARGGVVPTALFALALDEEGSFACDDVAACRIAA